MGKVLLITAVVLLVLAGIGWLLWWLCTRYIFKFLFGKPPRSKDIPAYYVGTPHYKVSRAGMKLMEDMPNQDLYLTSRDGLKLHAYLFPAPQGNGKKFVIGVHGYRSYARPECAPYVAFYHSLGYSMLMVDDRAHAPSEGEYIGFGILDRLDVVDWAKKLVSDYGEDTEILLHGVSMGGATVMAASGEEDLPEQVKGIISDCGYSSPWEILNYQLKHAAHLPAGLFLPQIERLCEKKIGMNLHDYAAVDQLKKAKVPVLFVQGMEDQMVPPEMVQQVYDACASPKRLLTVPQAGHGESIAFAPDVYHKDIIELFHIEQ